ncbi:CHRD domain-containing protein [Methylobacterium mesophilicum SR1.6/6]|uniref:CHRD domain-containing protein n=1 Tax=Methylobacterium mesophilicum SR1.6/6 TaxID=908290 RepID=A0A6B9FKX9_9HYPH|nr:CHRD domain-containing protein [Methylobacterium mesophilicum]QGY03261.1 CHRD domain-containing protein [Methylobacterium mesophilicum SR1.6/6]
MTRSASIRFAVLLAVAAAPLIGAPAFAADKTYRAALTGSSEVPPTQSQGTGEVTATFDPASKRLSWKGTYSGLTGPVTAAHFHGPAKAGENAGVLVPVTAAGSPFSGEAMLDDAKAADLEGGRLYFNIHTAANPKGEIRGQVEPAR